MTTPIEELKIRAKLLHKAIDAGDAAAKQRAATIARRRPWDTAAGWTLARCLNVVAAEAGFQHWQHARRVLGGEAQPGEDFGSFWYDERCAAMLNHWFASYPEAVKCHQAVAESYLLPFAKQFVVVQRPYIQALGLPAEGAAWMDTGRDLVSAYGSAGFYALAGRRLQAAQQSRMTDDLSKS